MLKSSGWLKGGTTKGEEGNNQMFSGKAVDTNIQSTTPQKFTCAVCGLPTLTCCSICKSVFYCSAPHQKLHWPKHKPECSPPDESISSQRNVTFMANNINHTSNSIPKNLNDSAGSFTSQSQQERNSLASPKKSQETQKRNSALDAKVNTKEDIFGNRLGSGTSIQEIESEESDSSREAEAQQNVYEMQINEIANKVAQMPDSHGNDTSFGSKTKFLSRGANNQISFEASQSLPKNMGDKGQDISHSETRIGGNKTEVSEETSELLLEERRKLLRDILKNMSQDQLEAAVLKCKKLVKLTDKLFHQMANQDFKLVCADYLLFARCLIKLDRIQEARNELLHLKRFVIEHVSDSKIDYRKGRDTDRITVRLMSTKKEFLNFLTDEGITMSKKKATLEILKDRTNIFSTLASLFYNIGDWNSCEDMYVKYTKITENNFGEDSFEAGDCYFVIGVFYLQHKYYLKAMACFKRSFAIRAKRLGGENFDVIADCYYNIGLVYKQTGNHIKAIYALNQALEIRATVIGETSLPVAQCLEILGKVYADKGDYKSAYIRFKDCLQMRKAQLDAKDPQLRRVQNLLLELRTKIIHDLTQTKQTKQTRETYESINEQLIQDLKGVKGLKLTSNSAANEAFLGMKTQNSAERQLRKDSRDSAYYRSANMKEPVTPPSEYNNESVHSEQGDRGAAFTDAAMHDEGKAGPTPGRSGGLAALVGRVTGKFGSARDKSPTSAADSIQHNRNQSHSSNFQLRIDNSIVMGMSSDQLMQMVQLQSRLRTVYSLDEAQRILIGSAFFRNLSLTDKALFKSLNPEYFRALSTKNESIFTAFIEKIANNDPKTDFRQPLKLMDEPDLNFTRGSRSNALKPIGSKIRGTLKRDSFSIINTEEGSQRRQSTDLKSEGPERETGEFGKSKRGNEDSDGSRENSQEPSGDSESLGKYKLQKQILQSVKTNSLFKGGLQSLKAKLAEKE